MRCTCEFWAEIPLCNGCIPPLIRWASGHSYSAGAPLSLLNELLLSQLNWVRCCQLSLNSLSEFFEVDLGISIEIKSPENGNDFLFTGQVAHGSKESLQILFVDVSIVPVVNGFEGGSDAEIVGALETPLDVLCLEVKLHLLVDELAHRSLNPHWQELVGVEFLIWSLSGS